MVKLLFLAGALRKDSFNKKLATAAYEIAKKNGVEATYIDLKNYEMPLYDGDIEASTGLPENAIKLKKLFAEADGFLISSPEYNSSMPAVLKNTLDWISRKHEPNEGNTIAFTGKIAALTAASPGALGGLRALVPLRMMLGNIGVHVTPNQFALGAADKAFDENGNLKDERQIKILESVVTQLIETTKKLKA